MPDFIARPECGISTLASLNAVGEGSFPPSPDIEGQSRDNPESLIPYSSDSLRSSSIPIADAQRSGSVSLKKNAPRIRSSDISLDVLRDFISQKYFNPGVLFPVKVEGGKGEMIS